MKKVYLIGILAIVWMFRSLAVTGPDGADYDFGPWLGPDVISVPGDIGQINITRRSITVTRRPGNPILFPTQTTIDLLTVPSLNLRWFGPRLDGYFIFNGQILGYSVRGARLLTTTGALTPGGDLTNALENVATDLGKSTLGGRYLDLSSVFGLAAIRPQDSHPLSLVLTPVGLKVTPGNAEFAFQSFAGNTLVFDYDSDLNVSAAYCNGQPVLVLGDPFRAPDVLGGVWGSAPFEIKVPSAKGPLDALRVSLDIHLLRPDRTIIVHIVLLKQNGSLWFGPGPNRLFVLGDRLFGIVTDRAATGVRQGQLLVYGSRIRIPVSYKGTSTAIGFHSAIRNFTSQVVTNGLEKAFDLESRVPVAELFAGFDDRDSLLDANVRGITFEGDNAVLDFTFLRHQAEIVVGPELQLIEFRRFDWNRKTGRFEQERKPETRVSR